MNKEIKTIIKLITEIGYIMRNKLHNQIHNDKIWRIERITVAKVRLGYFEHIMYYTSDWTQ